MRVLLDTSYLLSYLQISIEELPYDFFYNFKQKKENSILISEISLIELTAKGFKLAISGSKLTVDDIQEGLDAIKNDSKIEIVNWLKNPYILEIALEIRKIHSDFFDCIIFATAITEADVIGTFDDTLYEKIKKDIQIKKRLNEINKEFQFWFRDFKEIPKKLN